MKLIYLWRAFHFTLFFPGKSKQSPVTDVLFYKLGVQVGLRAVR